MASDRKARYDRRQEALKRRRSESQTARLRNSGRNMLIIVGGVAAAAAVVGVFVLIGIVQKELPPTEFGPGHSEQFPPTKINSAPIPRPIQEHVMERGGRSHREGSMLIQYNCIDYDCEPGFVDELVKIVDPYNDRVYLAPYPTMDAKIALAAPGRLETLDSLDEAKIRKFIEDNLKR